MDKQDKAKQELMDLLGVASFDNMTARDLFIRVNKLSSADYRKAKELLCVLMYGC